MGLVTRRAVRPRGLSSHGSFSHRATVLTTHVCRGLSVLHLLWARNARVAAHHCCHEAVYDRTSPEDSSRCKSSFSLAVQYH
eukprot:7390559-Prymnesium_polylepis.2